MDTGRVMQAIIPVKHFERAKSRLSGHLPPSLRAALAEAMFRDALETAHAAGIFAEIAVVSVCPRARAIAQAAGTRVIADAHPGAGTNAAVQTALGVLPVRNDTMVIHADLPLLTPEDLRRIARVHRRGGTVTLVPALDGGTTILVMSGADAIRPAFGPQSFVRHIAAARAAGIEPRLLAPPNAQRDLDRPSDLDLLAVCPRQSHCARLARSFDFAIPTPNQDGEGHAERHFDPGLLSFS